MNLDSEDEGELFIGCAGGIDSVAQFTYKEADVPAGYFFFKVEVKGLKGGHSGGDIHLGRGNANKILNRFLSKMIAKYDCTYVKLMAVTFATLSLVKHTLSVPSPKMPNMMYVPT